MGFIPSPVKLEHIRMQVRAGVLSFKIILKFMGKYLNYVFYFLNSSFWDFFFYKFSDGCVRLTLWWTVFELHAHTQASAARSSRLYATKGSSSGNLGGPGAPGAEPSRGSTPPTPGMTQFFGFSFFRFICSIFI